MKERLVFGMDIGGTRTKYGLIDLGSHQIVAQLTTPTETGGQAAFVRAAGKAAGELSQRIGLRIGEVGAGGVCVPGYVDGDQVSLVWETISFLEGITLRTSLQEELGFPIRLDNDGRTAAMGEAYFGGHTPTGVVGRPRRLLSLTLGTGVGVALVVDGRLLEKSSINHLAGHIPIRLGGGPCFCGFSGCLESLVAGPALVRNYARFSQEQEGGLQPGIDAGRVFALAAAEQPAALRAVRQLIDDLVVGLNAYIYLYGPDVIVLGGGLAKSLGAWLPLIRQGIFACPFEGYQVKLDLSTLGEQAGLYGAASLWE
jgi:glucokinase